MKPYIAGMQTRAVCAGRSELGRLGVHALPIDLSTTYPLPAVDVAAAILDEWGDGAPLAANPIYNRVFNPTVARFETAIAELEGTSAAVSFASGMAALTAVLLATRQRARRVLAVRPLYGTSDHLLASGLLDIDVEWVSPEHIGAAVGPEVGLVVLETPQNPTLGLVDIQAVVDAAGDVPVLVDNTFATPVCNARPNTVRHSHCTAPPSSSAGTGMSPAA